MSIEKIERLIEKLTKPHTQMHRSGRRVEKSPPSIQREAASTIRALLDEHSRLRKIEQRAETVCDSHERASVKEMPAGGSYFSIPAKELNDLSRAVTDLRRAISEREGQE